MAEAIPKLAACDKRLRTCTGWTIFFMVLLRIGIGWHFFYEGAWKLMQDDWRATSYLVMAQGPLREIFRGSKPLPVIGPMVPDVDGLEQLTVKGTQEHMDARCETLIKHYGITGDMAKTIRNHEKIRRGKAEQDPAFANAAAKLQDAVATVITVDFAAGADRAADGLVKIVTADFKATRPAPAATGQPAEAEDQAIKAGIQATLADQLDELCRVNPDLAATLDKLGIKVASTSQIDAFGRMYPELAAALNKFLTSPDYQKKFTTQMASLFDTIKPGVKAVLVGQLGEFSSTNPDLATGLTRFLSSSNYQNTFATQKAQLSRAVRDLKLGYVESIYDDADFTKQIDDYKKLLVEVAEYEHKLGTTGYNKERLLDQYGRKARTKAACIAKAEKPMADMDIFVVGDVMANRPGLLPRAFMDAKAANDPKADEIQKQLAKGLPHYPSPTCWIDWANMLTLAAVGAGLMLGLFTRLSALGGIGLLMLYYWCMPSLPWLPEAGPSEGHYLFINKNIIEALALAMIATSRVGRWGGLDGILFRGRRLRAVAGEIRQ